jgi:hypothetical protein
MVRHRPGTDYGGLTVLIRQRWRGLEVGIRVVEADNCQQAKDGRLDYLSAEVLSYVAFELQQGVWEKRRRRREESWSRPLKLVTVRKLDSFEK